MCVFVSNSVYVECVCAHTAFKCVKLVCVCVFGNGPSLACKGLWETFELPFSKQLFKLRII